VSVHSLPPAEARVETLFIHRRDGFASSALRAFLESTKGLPKTAEAA
jgi:LysR family transcriptional regulator, cell division regulator